MKINPYWFKAFLKGFDENEFPLWMERLTFAGIEIDGVENGIWDVSLTPNRGDCLSIFGLARELASLVPNLELISPAFPTFVPVHSMHINIKIKPQKIALSI